MAAFFIKLGTMAKSVAYATAQFVAACAVLAAIPFAIAYIPLCTLAVVVAAFVSMRFDSILGRRSFGVSDAVAFGFLFGGGIFGFLNGPQLSDAFEWHPDLFGTHGIAACNMWAIAGAVAGLAAWKAQDELRISLVARHARMLTDGRTRAEADAAIAMRLSLLTAALATCAALPYVSSVILGAYAILVLAGYAQKGALRWFVGPSAAFGSGLSALVFVADAYVAKPTHAPLLVSNLLFGALGLTLGSVLTAVAGTFWIAATDSGAPKVRTFSVKFPVLTHQDSKPE